MLRIRIRMDPELLPRSGSRINHSGSSTLQKYVQKYKKTGRDGHRDKEHRPIWKHMEILSRNTFYCCEGRGIKQRMGGICSKQAHRKIYPSWNLHSNETTVNLHISEKNLHSKETKSAHKGNLICTARKLNLQSKKTKSTQQETKSAQQGN